MTKGRVLVTGHRGYVGSVMAPVIRDSGWEVSGLDTDYYRGCDLVAMPDLPGVTKDIRDVEVDDFRGFDAVVHLAALSNDPIGNLNPGWTEAINLEGTRRAAQLAREAGVRKFLFSSSCIMYGLSDGGEVDETASLNPQTDYARSKVAAEELLRDMAAPDFAPVMLRNGTIYGLSPRMRFDTVLNSLVGAALTTGRITIMGDGMPWRPVVHLRDVSRAFAAVLDAPDDVIRGEAFNVGTDAVNAQVRQLAEAARVAVPDAVIEVLSKPDADQRTYRTRFGKFAAAFPDFRWEFTPATGAIELADSLRAAGLTHEQYTADAFTRLKWIHHLQEAGRVDGELRWHAAREAA